MNECGAIKRATKPRKYSIIITMIELIMMLFYGEAFQEI